LALTLVTQYDVEIYQKVEQSIGKRLEPLEVDHEEVMQLVERVSEAGRVAANVSGLLCFIKYNSY
jgi:ATP-dependent RNA helicase DDX47/RRP3